MLDSVARLSQEVSLTAVSQLYNNKLIIIALPLHQPTGRREWTNKLRTNFPLRAPSSRLQPPSRLWNIQSILKCIFKHFINSPTGYISVRNESLPYQNRSYRSCSMRSIDGIAQRWNYSRIRSIFPTTNTIDNNCLRLKWNYASRWIIIWSYICIYVFMYIRMHICKHRWKKHVRRRSLLSFR